MLQVGQNEYGRPAFRRSAGATRPQSEDVQRFLLHVFLNSLPWSFRYIFLLFILLTANCYEFYSAKNHPLLEN